MDTSKKIKEYTFSAMLFLFFLISANAQIPQSIPVALKAGNAGEISGYFNKDIELTILDKEGIYSKTQAEQIIKDFFTNYKPKNFDLLHEGGKGGSHYAIGELVTEKGTYRVYFLIKTINNQPFINQLRIEKD